MRIGSRAIAALWLAKLGGIDSFGLSIAFGNPLASEQDFLAETDDIAMECIYTLGGIFPAYLAVFSDPK